MKRSMYASAVFVAVTMMAQAVLAVDPAATGPVHQTRVIVINGSGFPCDTATVNAFRSGGGANDGWFSFRNTPSDGVASQEYTWTKPNSGLPMAMAAGVGIYANGTNHNFQCKPANTKNSLNGAAFLPMNQYNRYPLPNLAVVVNIESLSSCTITVAR